MSKKKKEEKNKLGVNDLCSCGSKNKFKRCCKNNTRPKNGVLTKAYTTGTDDPFMARIIFQICNIRDCVYKENDDRRLFDKINSPITQNLIETKLVKERCVKLIDDHILDVKNNKAAYLDKNVIRVNEPIDDDLNIWFKDFFIRGEMATKGLIKLVDHLGFDIAFIFADDKNYEKGKKVFLELDNSGSHQQLMKFIDSNRLWRSSFNDLRGKIVHHGNKLDRVKYVVSNNKAKPIFPSFKTEDGFINIKDLLNLIWENTFRFCEEIIVFFMNKNLPEDLVILFIPRKHRDPSLVVKYKVLPKVIINDFPKEKLYKIDFSC